MLKLPASVSISAAIHLVAVVWVGARELSDRGDAAPQPRLTEIEIVAPEPAPPPPVDVQFLDESATQPIEPLRAPAPKRKQPPRGAAIESRGTGTATIETSGTGPAGPTTGREPTGKRTPYFDMRRGGRADLTLPNFRDDLDHAPAGTSPQQGVAPSGQLEDSAGGRKKSHQDVFVAKVERDGSVRITDTRNLQTDLSWNPAKLLSGRFDVTDYLMRKTKNDPYSSRKLKFLDETRDERVEIGKQWRQQQLQQTAMIMRKNLERAWAQSPDVAARKQALFELWDEIVEPKPAHDQADEVLAEASRAARKAVIGFIRAHLPRGSEHGYSDSELVALNAKKQSSATFSPYE